MKKEAFESTVWCKNMEAKSKGESGESGFSVGRAGQIGRERRREDSFSQDLGLFGARV